MTLGSKSDNITRIGFKAGHQIVSLALPHCLVMPYWHFQLALSLYLHQLKSGQLSFKTGVLETVRPIDRIRGITGSDKNINQNISEMCTGGADQIKIAWCIFHSNAEMNENIARGTTDPGYWLFNLSYLYS